MKFFHHQRGVSLLETLILLTLLFLLFVGTMESLQYSLMTIQQAYLRTVMAEQLKGLSILQRAFPDHSSVLMDDWKRQTNKLLPSAYVHIQAGRDQSTLQVLWKASTGMAWYCSEPFISGYSCLELRIFYEK